MLDRSPLHLLHRAMQQVNDAFSSNVANITPRQLTVLIALDGNEGATQQALSDCTGVDRSTLSFIVRRLVRRQLVTRRRSGKDSRAYTVKLTSEGQRLLREMEPLARKVDQLALSVLPEARREQFLALLSGPINQTGPVTALGEVSRSTLLPTSRRLGLSAT